VELRGLWLLASCGHNKAGICERRNTIVSTNKKAFDKLMKRTEEDRKLISLWKVRSLFYSAMLIVDFERIHKAMLALDWRWGLPGRIPSVEELQNEVYSRLDGVEIAAVEGKYHRHDCGGFVVEYDDEEETVTIEFKLAGATAFEDGTDTKGHPLIHHV